MIALSLLSIVLAEKTVSFEKLQPQKLDGKIVQTYQGKPYTGQVFEYFQDGKKREEHNYVDGIEQGIQRGWSPEGKIRTERLINPAGTQLLKKWNWDGLLIYECNLFKEEPHGNCFIDCRDNMNYGSDACEVFEGTTQGAVWAYYQTGSKIGRWKIVQGEETFYIQHHRLGLYGKIHRQTKTRKNGEVVSTTVTAKDLAFEEWKAIDRQFILLRTHEYRFYRLDSSSSVNRIIQERYPDVEYFDVNMKPFTGKIMDFHEDLRPKLLVEIEEGRILSLKYYDEEGKGISGYQSERVQKRK